MLCNKTEKWLFKLEKDYTWNCGRPIPDELSFKDQKKKIRLIIKKNGDIIVTERYSWDGCTPKFCILDILFGIPDGAVDTRTGKPKTYYASLIHDALYQFLNQGIPYKRRDVDLFFLRLMEVTDFKLGWIYYIAVRIFGSLFHWYSTHFGKKKLV